MPWRCSRRAVRAACAALSAAPEQQTTLRHREATSQRRGGARGARGQRRGRNLLHHVLRSHELLHRERRRMNCVAMSAGGSVPVRSAHALPPPAQHFHGQPRRAPARGTGAAHLHRMMVRVSSDAKVRAAEPHPAVAPRTVAAKHPTGALPAVLAPVLVAPALCTPLVPVPAAAAAAPAPPAPPRAPEKWLPWLPRRRPVPPRAPIRAARL
jgi:hypothetical protein